MRLLRSLDPDAVAYCGRSGAADRRAISDFVKGLKRLGAWDGLVNAWMLPASQNAGTGTVLHGLKNADHNGTLVNGPTWTPTGINLASASSQYIEIGTQAVFRDVSDFTVMVVINPTTFPGSSNGMISRGAVGSDTIANISWNFRVLNSGSNTFQITDGTSQAASSTPGSLVALSQFSACYGGKAGNNLLATANGADTTASAGGLLVNNNAAHAVRIGTAPGNRHFNGLISFALFSNVSISTEDRAAILALYKSTIGRELLLP